VLLAERCRRMWCGVQGTEPAPPCCACASAHLLVELPHTHIPDVSEITDGHAPPVAQQQQAKHWHIREGSTYLRRRLLGPGHLWSPSHTAWHTSAVPAASVLAADRKAPGQTHVVNTRRNCWPPGNFQQAWRVCQQPVEEPPVPCAQLSLRSLVAQLQHVSRVVCSEC
jgi:hypothetical protein